MKKIIHQALQPLIGLPLRSLARSANMLSVNFGNLHEISTRDRGVKTVHDWTIQIQCPWRISQGDRIVIAYRDFYFSDVLLKNVDVMTKSRSDSILSHLCAEFDALTPVVSSVDSDDAGSFSVYLNHSYCLEAFPAESMEPGKSWRVYEPGIQGRSFVFPPSEME